MEYFAVRSLGFGVCLIYLLLFNPVLPLTGFGDTLTPLKCSVLLNIINYLLDPVMMFKLDLGAGGVAAATAVAQTVAVVPLLWILKRRLNFNIRGRWHDLSDSMIQHIKAGLFIMIQTMARIAAFTYCSRQSALLGSVAAAAYSVTFQIGFLITLVCESITVAVQALLSRELADESFSLSLRGRIVTHLVRTSILSGVGLTSTLAAIVYANRLRIVQIFSMNAQVQQAALAALPAFLATQRKFSPRVFRLFCTAYLLTNRNIARSGQRFCIPNQWHYAGWNGMAVFYGHHMACECSVLCHVACGDAKYFANMDSMECFLLCASYLWNHAIFDETRWSVEEAKWLEGCRRTILFIKSTVF